MEAGAAAQPRPRRVVYLSSYAGVRPGAREAAAPRWTDPPAPLTAYGRTKLAGEAAVRELAERGVEVVGRARARPSTARGTARCSPTSAWCGWAWRPARTGAKERLHMVFAPDLARALARAADAPPGDLSGGGPREHPGRRWWTRSRPRWAVARCASPSPPRWCGLRRG